MIATLHETFTQYHQNIDTLDLELLLAHTIDRSREFVVSHPEYILTTKQCARIDAFVKRRVAHEPIAYILGHKEFFGLDFIVTKDTLIPRPETELMAEEVLTNFEKYFLPEKCCALIDVGTGSGCIIISIAKTLLEKNNFSDSIKFFGVDISTKAIRIAQKNARNHSLEKKITFLSSDLLQSFFETIPATLPACDSFVITANLPYLSHAIYESSMPDVQNFEPKTALVSEEDGLNHYKRLFEQIHTLCAERHRINITILCEISPEQYLSLQDLAHSFFPAVSIALRHDLSGKWRFAIITL